MAALTAATLGVRLVGLDWGLPHALEPDAEISTQLEYLRGERRGKARHSDFATYPLAPAYLALATTRPDEAEPLATLEAHLREASDEVRDMRFTVAWTSALVVPATFLIARHFLSAGWSLFAAALMTFSLLGTLFGQQARPHAVAMAAVAWTTVCCLRMRRRPGTVSYLAAGLAAALAVGTLQSAIAALLPLATAHLLALRGAPAGKRLATAARGLIPLALIAASLPLFYPFWFEVAAGAQADSPRVEADRVVAGNHSLELAWFDGSGFGRVVTSLWRYEPVLLGLSVLALATWAARRPRLPSRGTQARGDLLVVASYALPYLLVIGLFGESYERFVLPLTPFIACAAAWGLSRLHWSGAPWLAAAALAFPVATSMRLAWLRTQPDTVERASAWLAERAGGEPIFLAPVPSRGRGDSSLELPLMRTERALERVGLKPATCYSPWLSHQLRHASSADPIERHSIRWVFLRPPWIGKPKGGGNLDYLQRNPLAFFNDSGTEGLFVIEPHVQRKGKRKVIELTSALRELGRRQERFAPDPKERDFALPFLPQDRYEDGARWPHYALRCLTARSLGPVVEIYRLDPARVAQARERRPLSRTR